MLKHRDTILFTFFLMLVLVFWICLSLLPSPGVVKVSPSSPGMYDLTSNDFSHSVFTFDHGWDSWPDSLYTPTQLQYAEAPVSDDTLDYSKVEYATFRLNLTLTPDETYALSYYSAEYAMHLYINGETAAVAGTPGTTRAGTDPQVLKQVVYFTPTTEKVELVVQTANFVHEQGAAIPDFVLGTAEGITLYERNDTLRLGIVFGCLITAGLYHLILFLQNRHLIPSLIFALLCILLALASGDFLARLYPSYNWQVSIRGEYLVYILSACLLTVLVNLLFPDILHKTVVWVYLFFCSLYSLIILFADTIFFSKLRTAFQLLSICMILYGFFRLALSLKSKKPKNYFAFLGFLSLCIFAIADILLRYDIQVFGVLSDNHFHAAGGMVLFVFCYAAVLSIDVADWKN